MRSDIRPARCRVCLFRSIRNGIRRRCCVACWPRVIELAGRRVGYFLGCVSSVSVRLAAAYRELSCLLLLWLAGAGAAEQRLIAEDNLQPAPAFHLHDFPIDFPVLNDRQGSVSQQWRVRGCLPPSYLTVMERSSIAISNGRMNDGNRQPKRILCVFLVLS